MGAEDIFLPFFYYQEPLAPEAYVGVRPFGKWFSTPKDGRCGEDQPLGTNGCTWKRGARARVIYGDELLRLDWNATVVKHWPLHRTAHNNTRQCLHNLPIFREALARHAVQQAPCGPEGAP